MEIFLSACVFCVFFSFSVYRRLRNFLSILPMSPRIFSAFSHRITTCPQDLVGGFGGFQQKTLLRVVTPNQSVVFRFSPLYLIRSDLLFPHFVVLFYEFLLLAFVARCFHFAFDSMIPFHFAQTVFRCLPAALHSVPFLHVSSTSRSPTSCHRVVHSKNPHSQCRRLYGTIALFVLLVFPPQFCKFVFEDSDNFKSVQ